MHSPLLSASLAALLLGLLPAPHARAATLVVHPAADAVLYEDGSGQQANGAGEFLLAGRTNQGTGSRRRSLLQFDLTGLPTGAVLVSVTLQLHSTTVATGPVNLGLHRVLTAWTTGASNPSGNESAGAAVLAGDATWFHASAPAALWSNPGGDFAADASAESIVNSAAGWYAWTGAGLLADVQGWIMAPASNAGWILRSDELTPQTAKRFDSADTLTPEFRPALTIEYTPVPEPGASVLLFPAALASLRRRRRSSN